MPAMKSKDHIVWCLQEKRALVMSIFNWGIYAGIGLAFPIGRYVTEHNLWNKVSSQDIQLWFWCVFISEKVHLFCNCIICHAHLLSHVCWQSWRVPYYFSGVFGLLVALLCAVSIPEPSRKTIGEENEEKKEENEVSAEAANRNIAQTKLQLQREEQKQSPWKVMLQPRIIMLCLAASIRHTGTHYTT